MNSKVSNMPERPLHLHEVRLIQEENEEVNNAEALYYEDQNLNATITVFLNIEGVAYILGYDPTSEEWMILSTVSKEQDVVNQEESEDVISWVSDRYEDFGVYRRSRPSA